jgi:hypothetical protein
MPVCFGMYMSASRLDSKWLGVFLLVFWCPVCWYGHMTQLQSRNQGQFY